MRKHLALGFSLLSLLCGAAHAQQGVGLYTGSDGSLIKPQVSLCPPTTGNVARVCGGFGTPLETSVSCGTSSTTLLAASTATQFILIKVPSTAANAVWFNYAGVAAVTAAPSIDLIVGGSQLWTLPGYLVTSQINCIASSPTTVTVVYK